MINYFTGRINEVVDVHDLSDMTLLFSELSDNPIFLDEEWLRCSENFPNAYIILARASEECGENGFAKVRGKIVGMTFLNFSIKSAGIYGYVDDVVVREKFRGNGIVGGLLAEVDILCARFGAWYSDLSCGNNPKRALAHRAYRRHGYVSRDSTLYRKKY